MPLVQESPVAHIWHAPPLAPHAAVVLPGWHVLPWQQPVGHEAASQTHLPLEHACPLPQAVLPPQVQAPLAEQPSPVVPQLVHVAPLVPQAIADGVVHVVPEQQPLAHEAASQTHLPPAHSCPVPHAALPPQVQVPLAEQPSAFVPQLVHVAPAVPHAIAVGVVHVLPEQHPLGQLEALQPLQAPLVHVSPFGHMEHVPPAAPHAFGFVPGWQVFPWQQPVGHDVASHTHVPLEHAWPLPHAALPPQVQVPRAEQPSAVAPQAMHAAPAVPQAVVEGVVHVFPEQHPEGHVTASQPVTTSAGASMPEVSGGASAADWSEGASVAVLSEGESVAD